MSQIRKAVITGFGDESKIVVANGVIGEPVANEVQIKIEYSGFSGADINMRKGIFPFQKKAPFTPGYSVVGKVHRNGSSSKQFQIGERVVCMTMYDGQAELINVPERFLARVPATADPQQAVALVLDWLTAYEMIFRIAQVKTGQKVFIHGLSGGVGRGLLSLSKLQGAEIFGTAAQRNHPGLKELDATIFPYSDKNWIQAVNELGRLL